MLRKLQKKLGGSSPLIYAWSMVDVWPLCDTYRRRGNNSLAEQTTQWCWKQWTRNRWCGDDAFCDVDSTQTNIPQQMPARKIRPCTVVVSDSM